MKLKIYKDKQEVAEQFSEFLTKRIKRSNGQLNISLSGGSTPKIVFDHLADNFSQLEWSKVNFFWGDERCVPPENEESNYKMTVDHLFSKIDVPEENIYRIKGENTPTGEAATYGETLSKVLPVVNGVPEFDLIILGMGGDGHTASIFQSNIHLWDSHNNCEVAVHPDSGQKRVTITGKVINQAKEVVFLVTGADKKEKVATILKGDEISKSYPAGLVNPSSGNLYWYLDEAAVDNSLVR